MIEKEKIEAAMSEFTNKIDEIFVGTTPKIEGELDGVYDCDIYIFRHPGMGSSKQIIMGNKVSIMTATSSYLDTLVRQGVIDIEELEGMMTLVIDKLKKNK